MKTKNGKTEIIAGIVMLYATWMMYGINFCYTLGKTHNFFDSLFGSFNITFFPVLLISGMLISGGIKMSKTAKAFVRNHSGRENFL